MPAFQINDAEWSALVEEPGDIFLVYCSIRRYMDYETGIAGVRRRFSEQMLREVLYVAPTRGRHDSGSPTRQRVRSVLDRLITLGVLLPAGPMVYQLPLATRDGLSETSATEQQPDQQPHQQPNTSQPEPSNSGALTGSSALSATTSESDETGNNNLPPISGKSITPPPRAHDFDARTKFAMHPAWEPVAKTFQATLTMNGLAGVSPSIDLLNEFKSFWTASPDEHRTQARWEHALAQHLKREHRHGQANGRSAKAETNQNGSQSQRPYRQGRLSAVDRVNANIERNRAERAKSCGTATDGVAGEAMGDHDRDIRPPLDVEFWREPQS